MAKTVAFLKSLSAEQIDGSEDRAIALKVGGADASFPGHVFLMNFVLPNLYFHITAA